MEVEVHVYAHLRKYLKDYQGGGLPVNVPDGATVGDLLALLGLPEQEAQVVLVNGLRQDLTHPLQPADRVGIFPIVGGG